MPLPALILTDPSALVATAMIDEPMSFGPHDRVGDAATAFDRYDLVSAPVIDERGKLVGRLTVDAVMDFVRDESNMRALKRAGLAATRTSLPAHGRAHVTGGRGWRSIS